MDFKVLKRSHLKRNIIIGVVVVAIISAVVLTFTRAKYRVTESIPLVNGTINYSPADLNIVAITVDGEIADRIPQGNYTLTEESYCTVNGEENDSIIINYDMNSQNLTITPFTTKGTKCYLDFVTATTKKVDTILGIIDVNLDEPDFSKTSCSNGCGEDTVGIYEAEDDSGTTYYYRGDVDNNYLYFGGFYWRIIRINGNGSIRILYNGTSTDNGIDTMINNYQIYNMGFGASYYVGLNYGNTQHGTGTKSDILLALDEWYNNNLSHISDYIDSNIGFCSDREMANGYTWSEYPNSTILYAANDRLSVNQPTPSFKCNNNNDILHIPIGLITADEAAFAGGVYSTQLNNSNYYLYNGFLYWTMTPSFSDEMGYNRVLVEPGTSIIVQDVNNGWGARPVINLKADVIISSGDGTSSNPYIVS